MSDHTHQGGEQFTVTIRAMRSDVPPMVRLKRCLKSLGRVFEFQCLRVVETTPQLPQATPAALGQGEAADGASDAAEGRGEAPRQSEGHAR